MEKNQPQNQEDLFFSQDERSGLYKTIFNRRDVRGQFKPDPIPDDVLSRVLYAAHHAPSVGFMQPWNFVVVRSQAVKQKVHHAFVEANDKAADMFESEKSKKYRSLKLEGILESPVNICITCDRQRTGPVVIGRTSMKEMDLYSSVCAVQNFWLAARAEGLGVGWVSIIEQQALQEALAIPADIVPIAYLCVGYVSHFFDKPELETAGWLKRTPLDDLLYFDQWGEQKSSDEETLVSQVIEDKQFPGNW
ncbi:5,6-dimethylbenzimidazole synthase [Alkalimarinus sediminis]|uniref:5,6-dimethylbenzimidazole synthase n=1 Tax=Alkalimarinus sediminis TaxID=1632866 RepID=A0A9E8KR51_9ALTE|nr:5,6-dimethylbenzimidazole synthase [Alkalimarinus sediminis]UZW76609.1 5,6-dimethylbenzimidazole synthase [Alkalimarinus sediminis]